MILTHPRDHPSLPSWSDPRDAHRRVLQWAIVSVALSTCACGSSGAVVREVSAYDHADRRVSRALRDADAEANHPDLLEVEARYNPTECACPAWELRIGGIWQRVSLEGVDDEGLSPGTILSITVRETHDTVSSSTGWSYGVYEVTERR